MKEILVVREFDKFSELLTDKGLTVVSLPLIQTVPVENIEIKQIEHYDGLFFTSPQAAKVFLREFNAKKFDGKIYILGNRTRKMFAETDYEVVFRDDANTAEELINSLETSKFAGKKFLYLCGDKSLRTIPELLKDVAEIDEKIVYQTIEKPIANEKLNEINRKFQHQTINCVCFFSPSGVENFVKSFDKGLLKNVKIAAIGTTTAKSLAENNLQVDFVSKKARAEDFARELTEYLRENSHEKDTK